MSNSPFEIFRRNLKPLMVLLTGLALFAFVVLPVMDTYMRSGAAGTSDAVVASYGNTKLTQSRVEYFTRNHNSVVRFLYELADQTIARGGMPQTAGFQQDPNTNQIRSVGINQQPSIEGSIRTLMLASQAQKQGFDLDDTAINSWLDRFTDGQFSDGQINGMLMKSTQNQMGRQHLNEQLRSHLLANVFLTRGMSGLYSVGGPGSFPLATPEEQWSNFLKLNRNAVASAYGVLVSDYIEQTNKTPSSEEIQKIYDEGKNRYDNTQSPEPGFRRRYTAEFEYLSGSPAAFLDAEVAKLSEEQIRAEYDKQLAGGELRLPESEAIAPEADTESGEATITPETEGTPSDAAEATPATSDEPTEPSSAPDANADAPAAETPEAETPEAETPEAEAPAAEAPAAEAPAAEAPEAGQPESTDQSARSAEAVRLVATQESTQSDAAAVQEEAVVEASEPQVVADPQPAEANAAEANAEEANAEAVSSQDGEGEATTPTETDSSPVAEETPVAEGTPGVEPAVRSYEDERQRIAEQLAAPAAAMRLNAVLTDAFTQMQTYKNKLAIYKGNLEFYESKLAAGEKTEMPKEPAKPNLKKFAEENGLEYSMIGPYSAVNISDEPIALSSELGTQMGPGPGFPIIMYGFNNGQTNIEPKQLLFPVRTTNASDGKQYLSWKTAETEPYVPTLEDARAEVVMAIRKAEARGIAEEAAKKIAEQMASGKTLDEVVPETRKDQIQTAMNPFTWMQSFGFQGASIGNVEELDSVGEDFMKAVFNAGEGKPVVAANQPKTVYYVVIPTRFEPSLDELMNMFKQPANRMMAMLLGNDSGNIISDFYKNVDEDADYVNFIDPAQE